MMIEHEAMDAIAVLVTSAREPLVVLDRTLRVLRASRAFGHLCALETDALMGQRIDTVVPRTWDIPRLMTILTTVVSRGMTYEDDVLPDAGSAPGIRHLLLTARPLDAEGRVLLVVDEDAERAGTEAQETIMTQRLQDLFMQAPAIIAVLRGPTHIVDLANPRYLQIVGPTREIVGKPIREALPEVAAQGFIDLLDTVYATGTPAVGTEVPVHLDRTGTGRLDTVYVNFVYQPVVDTQGTVEGIFVQGVDVTEQVQAKRHVQESEGRFRFLAESMPQKVFTATPEGDVDYFNPQWTEFTGLSFEEIRDWGWLQFIHPDDRAENIRVWQHSIDTGDAFQLEHRFRRHDGVYRWHLSRAHPLRDESGRILKWFGSNTDIDDQKRALEQKDAFMSMVSHELKTPITSVKGFGQLAEKRAAERGDGDMRHLLAKMNACIDTLAQLIADLLDLSRSQMGRLVLVQDSFSLDALTRETVEMLQATTTAHQLLVEGAAPEPLWGDRDRIGQVLVNLLTNAIKYTPGGGEIRIEVATDAERVTVRVRDQGIGIAPEHLEKLFDRFYQVHDPAARQPSGLGIGLYLSADIIRRHGGRIWADSQPGLGSTFSFTLPLPGESARPVDPRRCTGDLQDRREQLPSGDGDLGSQRV